MIRSKKTAWVFVASLAVNILFIILRGQEFSFAEILGGTLGLMFAPYLLAFLVKWTCQLFKTKFEEGAFNITYAIGWIFLGTGNILVSL
jgi:hypothetical protein